MNIDDSGNGWWSRFWKSIGGAIVKVVVGVVIIATLAVASVVTGGLASVVLAGAAIGALGGAVGGGISGAISGGFQGFANGFLAGSITGAISGAVGASPLVLGFQIAINAGLGMLNYAMNQGFNGESITLGGLVTSGVLGGIAGFLGGSGWMHGTKDLLKLDVTKNFLRVALSYAGKAWTIKALINSIVLSGFTGGIYGKFISGKFNSGGKFLGW